MVTQRRGSPSVWKAEGQNGSPVHFQWLPHLLGAPLSCQMNLGSSRFFLRSSSAYGSKFLSFSLSQGPWFWSRDLRWLRETILPKPPIMSCPSLGVDGHLPLAFTLCLILPISPFLRMCPACRMSGTFMPITHHVPSHLSACGHAPSRHSPLKLATGDSSTPFLSGQVLCMLRDPGQTLQKASSHWRTLLLSPQRASAMSHTTWPCRLPGMVG